MNALLWYFPKQKCNFLFPLWHFVCTRISWGESSMEKDHSNGRNFSNETLMGAARQGLTKSKIPSSSRPRKSEWKKWPDQPVKWSPNVCNDSDPSTFGRLSVESSLDRENGMDSFNFAGLRRLRRPSVYPVRHYLFESGVKSFSNFYSAFSFSFNFSKGPFSRESSWFEVA